MCIHALQRTHPTVASDPSGSCMGQIDFPCTLPPLVCAWRVCARCDAAGTQGIPGHTKTIYPVGGHPKQPRKMFRSAPLFPAACPLAEAHMPCHTSSARGPPALSHVLCLRSMSYVCAPCVLFIFCHACITKPPSLNQHHPCVCVSVAMG